MTRRWYDVEGPTWLVAATIYAGWIALAFWHRSLPLAILLPLAVYLTAWHASLQHETIHALRRVPRPMRTLVAIVPLGIWFPYEWYRQEHLRHHATRDIAGSNDPESFYHDSATWAKMSAPLRALYLLNATFAGRLVLGPAIQIVRTYAGEIRRLRSGDTTYARVWCAHIALAGAVLWVLAYCGIHPIAYIAFVAYPASSLSLVRSFAEHRYAHDPQDRTAIVESRSALSLLFLNNNLHAIHHRYPGLPWFELPQAYRRERERSAHAPGSPTLRGYRTVARRWLLRPIDFPVAGAPGLTLPTERSRRVRAVL